MRENNRAFAVVASAILKASLSMEQKVDLLRLVSIAIESDSFGRLLERDLREAERAYRKKPSDENRVACKSLKRNIALLDSSELMTAAREALKRGKFSESHLRLDDPALQPAINPPDLHSPLSNHDQQS